MKPRENLCNDERRPISAPTVPYFLAVVAGILTDAWFDPGRGAWVALAFVALVAFAVDAALSIALAIRKSRERTLAASRSEQNDGESSKTSGEETLISASRERNIGGDSADASSSNAGSGANRDSEGGADTNRNASASNDAEYWRAWLAANPNDFDVATRGTAFERRGDRGGSNVASGRKAGLVPEPNIGWNDALRAYLRSGGEPGKTGRLDVSEGTVGRAAAEVDSDGADDSEFGLDGWRTVRRDGAVWLTYDGDSTDEPRASESAKAAFGESFRRRWRAFRRRASRSASESAASWRRAFVRNRAAFRTAWALAAVAALAGFRHSTYFNVFPENEIAFAAPEAGVPTTLDARVVRTPVLYRRAEGANPFFANLESTSLVVETERAKNRGNWEEYSGKIAVSIDGDATELRVGDRVRLVGRLAPPPKPGNPGERDRRYSLRTQRILTTLSVKSAEYVERLPETEPPSLGVRVARRLASIRTTAARALSERLKPRNAAVACGMTFDFRNEIDDETNETFLRTGTIHLLSISGLHVALVAGFFAFLLRALGVPPRLGLVATALFAVFYLGLTDVRTPALRAVALALIFCVGALFKRRSITLNSLTTTAIALLFWNPCELFQLGAQLSFLATGVFLWSGRTSLRDSAARASERWAAILERRRAFQNGRSTDGGANETTKNETANKTSEDMGTVGESLDDDASERDDATSLKASNEKNGDANDRVTTGVIVERTSFVAHLGANATDDGVPVVVEVRVVDATPTDETAGANGLKENWRSRWRRNIKSALRRGGRYCAGRVWTATKTGAVVWAVATPLAATATNLATPVAVLANAIVWAPATFALLAAFVLAVFGTLAATVAPTLGAWGAAATAPIADLGFDVFLGALDLLRRPSCGAFRVPTPSVWALWAFYAPLVFWTLFPSRRPTLKTGLSTLAVWLVAAAVAACVPGWDAARRDSLRVDVLSVGHGVAALAFFPDGRTALFDCGSVSSSEKASELVAKALSDVGKSRIDLALISHSDFDHYGGFATLDESISIGRVCVSPATFRKENAELTKLRAALERRKTPVETVLGGETLERFGFPEIAILHPTPDGAGVVSDESNANSLVVALAWRGRKLMFPGDLDAPDAAFLRSPAPSTRFDLTLAPHHGGKSENYRGLLDWANPVWVVVSGGTFQRNFATENELRAEGRRVLHTLDDGRVRIEIDRDPRDKRERERGSEAGEENAVVGRMRVSTFRSGKTFESGDF